MMEDTITLRQVNRNPQTLYEIKVVLPNWFYFKKTFLIVFRGFPVWAFSVQPISYLAADVSPPLCRDLHGSHRRPLFGDCCSNSSAGRACRSCALGVQSQRAEVGHSGLLEWPPAADPRSVRVWGVCVLQPHPPLRRGDTVALVRTAGKLAISESREILSTFSAIFLYSPQAKR